MMVSVCIPTYNHVQYIAQCLESVLSQLTDFDYEILIGEDDSSDGTRQICRRYALNFPEKIRLFLNDRRNVIYIQGRATGRWNFMNLLKNARGKYIALLDGDDYWTSPYKLQKQVDCLEGNSGYAICFHSVKVVSENSGESYIFRPPHGKAVSTIEDLLIDNYIPSCSAVFRARLFESFPEWFYKLKQADWSLHVMNAQHGDIVHVDNVMAVHRNHEGGVWSKMSWGEQFESIIESHYAFNGYLKYRYDRLIKSRIAASYRELLTIYDKDNDIVNLKRVVSRAFFVIRYFGYANFAVFFAMAMKCYLPFVYRVARRTKKIIQGTSFS